MNTIADIFRIEKSPKKGLLAIEWVVMGYLVLTLLLMLFTYTKLHNPESMLWGRLRVVAMTAAVWFVYRLVPCRLTLFFRVALQMALLSWWYPDTYEFNRMFPNLDHIFAQCEQNLFGCQPSLLFCRHFSGAVFSELMDLGYSSYFPMIVIVTVYFFGWRYREFGRASFVILASFFIYYIIYIALPVTGPQYYYNAVGLAEIARGNFPDLGHYFATHQDALTSPGYQNGFFYRIVADAHAAGERPTAAFPSSHVGISTILMLLVWTSKNRALLYFLLPFYVLLCFSTVYIYAHYTIDVFAGWVSAAVFFAVLYSAYGKFAGRTET